MPLITVTADPHGIDTYMSVSVTVGLVWHWPCVSHRQYGLHPPMGSTAYVREMRTPPTLLRGFGTPYLLQVDRLMSYTSYLQVLSSQYRRP